MPGRMRSRGGFACPIACVAAAAACHEVVALPPPPLDGASAAALVTTGPSGRPAVALGAVPLEGAGGFVLGPERDLWVFGYGCPVERLARGGAPSGPIALPRPGRHLRWSDGWRDSEPDEVPSAVRALFGPDGEGPCATFVPRPEVSFEAILPASSPGYGLPYVQLLSDREGGALILQPVFDLSSPGGERLGARVLRLDASGALEELEPLEAAPARRALAWARRGDAIVWIGADGLFTGSPGGPATRVDGPFPELDEAQLGVLAVSSPREPLRAFVNARFDSPVDPAAPAPSPRAAAYRWREGEGLSMVAQRLVPVPLPTGFVPPSIAGAADGTVIAAGPTRSGSVVRIAPDPESEREQVSLIGQLIVSVHQHPALGLSAMNAAGTLYRRSDDGSLLPEWVPVRIGTGERGVLAWTVLDGIPAALLFDEAQAPGSSARGRVWLSLATEGRVCDGEPSPLPAVNQTFAGHTGHVAAVPTEDGRAFWVLRVADDRVGVLKLSFAERAGGCSQL